MKSVLLATGAALALCACTTNTNQQTFWGKEGVSMLDYRTDGGQCAVLAATANTETSGVHTAGGVSGNSTARLPPQAERTGGPAIATGEPAPAPSGAAFPTGAGGAYRDNTTPGNGDARGNPADGAGTGRAEGEDRCGSRPAWWTVATRNSR